MIRQGQVALIVALMVVVGLTVVVAVASQSVTTISVSTQEEERARAFSAAEAGVEDALRQSLATIAGGTYPFEVGSSNVSYSVTQLTDITTTVNPGDTVTVDWSKSSPAAVSFSVNWDGEGCSSSLSSSAITPAGGVTHDVTAAGPKTFAKGSGGVVRMRFVGCESTVTITGTGGALSFYRVDATGMSGESQSSVEVYRSESAPVNLMDFAVFSGTTIQ